jgi:protocatechuate 3,4-dioxygenase beta subunit
MAEQEFSPTRRETLGLIALGAAGLMGVAPSVPAQARKVPACVVRPAQTEGPFFVDARLERSDIRSDPASRAVKAGVPLRLAFNVSSVGPGSCAALPGAQVHVWHCDAAGSYSGVRDRSADTRGQQFLRGYQLTDVNGIASFQTVYPGWYRGRAVHVHFKIRYPAAAGRAREFTSQIYFEDAVSDAIFTLPPYAARGKRDTRNADDGLYARGGRELTLPLAKENGGYAGTFEIGLASA